MGTRDWHHRGDPADRPPGRSQQSAAVLFSVKLVGNTPRGLVRCLLCRSTADAEESDERCQASFADQIHHHRTLSRRNFAVVEGELLAWMLSAATITNWPWHRHKGAFELLAGLV